MDNNKLLEYLEEKFAGIDSRFESLEKGLRTDMENMEEGLSSDMKTMENDLRSDMKTMGEDLRSEMKAMGDDLRSDIERLEGKVDKNTSDIEMIKTQTAGLLEFRTEISKKVDNVHADLKREISFVLDKTVKNEKDIYDLSEQHERLRQKFEVSEAD